MAALEKLRSQPRPFNAGVRFPGRGDGSFSHAVRLRADAFTARSWPFPERPRRQAIHWGLLAVPSNFAVVLKGSYFPVKAADLVFVSRADIRALSSGRNVRAASIA